jgi:hypothetical protein
VCWLILELSTEGAQVVHQDALTPQTNISQHLAFFREVGSAKGVCEGMKFISNVRDTQLFDLVDLLKIPSRQSAEGHRSIVCVNAARALKCLGFE